MVEPSRLRARFVSAALLVVALISAPPMTAAPPSAPHPRTVKVAAIQCSSVLGDVVGNRKKLSALVTEAAEAGAKIIVLPEAAVTGYLSQDLKINWRLKGKPIDATF